MRTRRLPLKFLLVPAVVIAAFGLAACGDDGEDTTSAPADTGAATTTEAESTAPEPGANAPAPSGEAVRAEKVEIAEYTYDPDPVTIQVGGKVTWINRDPVAHTATAPDGSFDTGPLDEGKLKSETFKEPGTYGYFCKIHPQMHGTIEVVESG